MPNDPLSQIVNRSDTDALITKHADRTGLDPDFIRRVVRQESGGNSKARSWANAQGTMQLMPGTAKRFGVKNLNDPDENIRGGTDYLKELVGEFGDPKKALAAYNAGEGAVRKHGYEKVRKFSNFPRGDPRRGKYQGSTGQYVDKIAGDYSGSGWQDDPLTSLTKDPSSPATSQSEVDPLSEIVSAQPSAPIPSSRWGMARQPPVAGLRGGPSIKLQPRSQFADVTGGVSGQIQSGAGPVRQSPSANRQAPNINQILTEATHSPEAEARSQIRKQVTEEQARENAAFNPRLGNPLKFNTGESGIDEEVERRRAAQIRAGSLDVTTQRKDFGNTSAPIRSLTAPAARFGAGLLKSLGGLTSNLGLTPNDVSEYLNQKGDTLETASSMAPLDAQGEEIERGVIKMFGRDFPAEKLTAAVGDLGFGIAQIIALKKAAPSRSLTQIMAMETALKTSDLPIGERTKRITEAAIMGRVLEQHMSKAASALAFGAPTAVESVGAYRKGEMSAEDALINTGVQTAAGAVLGGKKPVEVPGAIRLRPRGEQNARQAESDRAGVRVDAEQPSSTGVLVEQGRDSGATHHSQRQNRRARNTAAGTRGQFKKGKVAQTKTKVPAVVEQAVEQAERSEIRRELGYPAEVSAKAESRVKERTLEDDLNYAKGTAEMYGGEVKPTADGYEIDMGRGTTPVKTKTIDETVIKVREYATKLDLMGITRKGKSPLPSPAVEPKPTSELKAAPAPKAENVASVPFMITRKMEAQLKERGYSQGDIDKLTPQRANDILAAKAEQPSTSDVLTNPDRGMSVRDQPKSELKGETNVQTAAVKTEAEKTSPVSSGKGGNDSPPLPPSEKPVIKLKPRTFQKSAEKAGLPKGEDLTYAVNTDVGAVERANQRIKTNGADKVALELQRLESVSKDDIVAGSVLAHSLTAKGDIKGAVDVVDDLARKLTQAGQSVQAASLISRLSPEGVLLAGQRRVPKGTKLSEDQGSKLVDLAARVQKAEAKVGDFERQLAEMKRDSGAMPVTKKSARERIGTLQDRLLKMEQDARARMEARAKAGVSETAKGERGATTIIPDIADMAIIGAAKLGRKGITLAKWTDEMVKEFGDGIRPKIKSLYRDSYKLYDEQRKQFSKESSERSARRAEPSAKDIQAVINNRALARKDARTQRAELIRLFRDLSLTKYGKVKAVAGDVLNVPRTLKSSVDLSAPRQGAMWMINHPVQGVKLFFGKQLKAMREVNYDRFVDKLESDPDYPLMTRSGLALTTTDARPHSLSAREEAFMSRIAGSLPGVKQSERAYSTFLDTARSSWFKQLKNQAENKAKSEGREITPEQYQAIANFVNIGTGRGNLGKGWLNDASPFLNAVFFAPKFAASKVQIFDPRVYARLPPGARRSAMREAATHFGAMTTAAMLLKYGMGATVGTDPEDSEFMKVRSDNTRYDLSNGTGQYVTLASRLLRNAENKRTGTKDPFGKSFADNIDRFTRYKYSPPTAMARNVWEGKNAIGEKTSLKKESLELIAPLFLKDLYDAYHEEGLTGVAKTSPAFVGVGVNTYNRSSPSIALKPRHKSGSAFKF